MTSFSLYLPGTAGLHRLHPLTKLTLSGTCLVAAAALPQTWQVLAVFALGLLPLAAWSSILRPFLVTTAHLIWPFALSLFLIQGFFHPGDQELFAVGPFQMTLEGLQVAASFSARILLGIASAILLLFTTRPDRLMQALTERGLPHQLGYVVVTTMQIIPRFQAKAGKILDAQRARGLQTEGSLGRRVRGLLPLVGPLVLGSLIDIDERAIALEARAFSRPGPKTSLHVLADSAAQRVLRGLLLALMIALPLVRLWSLLAP